MQPNLKKRSHFLLIMINRTIMRIKILQVLYSFYKGDGKSLPDAEKELLHNFERTYDLYFHLFLLSIELTNFAAGRIDARRNKYRPTEEDLNPNTRFIDNLFIKQLSNHREFKQIIADRNISWDNNRDALKDIFEELIESDVYKGYMKKPSYGIELDKSFWRQVFLEFIPTSVALEETLEEQCMHWCDSLEMTASFVAKTIRYFRRNNRGQPIFLPMFKNEDDWDYSRKLFRSAIENAHEYLHIIDETTRNWELDRMADMDILIMQMALAEIFNFPAIPVSVTLNEYINIAKTYSTENSGTFVNGVLDKVVKQLREENKLIKVIMPNENKEPRTKHKEPRRGKPD